jgi:hypothetical protein
MTKFHRISITVVSMLTLVGAMAFSASAQILNTPTTDVQKPFSVKLGVLFPTTGAAQNFGGSTQFSAGLDYALAKTTADNPALPSLYVDYTGGSRNGGHIYSTGVGVAIRTFTSSIGNHGQAPYVGAGVGVYDTMGKRAGGTSNTDVNFGGKVFVGDEISGGFFIEGNYQFLPSSRGINPSGFGVQAGFRF